MKFVLPMLALLSWSMVSLTSIAGPLPLLTNAHSHNDYEQKHPLFDALDQGFCSVEADIWLVDGKLLVGHTSDALQKDRTLQSLYLDPLLKRVRLNKGRVYAGGPPCMLLIDVKTEAAPTYAVLRTVLQEYREILTTFTDAKVVTNAITAVISGNRAPEVMALETERLAGIDGRLPDLEGKSPVGLIPLVSDSWTSHFKWTGHGEFPTDEKVKLRELVKRAHAQGRTIRLWANPDNAAGWDALREAGVDWINTDHLAALRTHFAAPR